jgi:hypothetical protein
MLFDEFIAVEVFAVDALEGRFSLSDVPQGDAGVRPR